MNCDEFNSMVTDLARGIERDRATQGPAREQEERVHSKAEEHARDCRRCAERLENERELSGRLRAMALADSSEEATTGVEARLVEEIRARGKRRLIPAWQGIAAACLVLAISMLGARWAMQEKHAISAPASEPLAQPVSPNPACCPQRAAAETPAEAIKTSGKHSRAKRSAARGIEARRLGAPDTNAGQTSSEVNSELATEFFAVPFGSTLDPITAGEILRIRLPRSAMSAVGLPVNEESARGQVDADVLMDENMTVRAIRFVQ